MSGKSRGDDGRLDPLELGKTVQLLYDAFSLVEAVGGSLSPYVPTMGSAAGPLAGLAAAWAEARARARGARGTPVYYEPGCGTAAFASLVASSSPSVYIVCLELDEQLAVMARERLRAAPLADTVVGDLSVFRPRRSDAAYAYLLPRAVDRLLQALEGTGTPIISLDYPAESDRGALHAAKMEVQGRTVYIYQA